MVLQYGGAAELIFIHKATILAVYLSVLLECFQFNSYVLTQNTHDNVILWAETEMFDSQCYVKAELYY